MADNKHYTCIKSRSWEKVWETLKELDQQTVRHEEQIKNQDKVLKGIKDLTESVLILAQSVGVMEKNLENVVIKVEEIERAPGTKFERYKEYAVSVGIGALVMYFLQSFLL